MPTEFSFEEATQPVKSFTFEEATAPKSFSFEEAQTTTATTPKPSPLAQGINEQNKLAVETFGKAMDMLAIGAEAGAIQGQRTEAGIRAIKKGLGELETPPTQSIPQPKLPQRATIGGKPQSLETYIGTPEERQAEFKQAALSPVIPIPKFTINADDSKTMAVGKSIVNFLTGIVEFAESPAGILAAPVAAAAPTATAAFFTADMANSIGNQATEMGLNWDKMTEAQKAAAVTDTSATGLLALALGTSAGRSVAAKAKQGLETIAVKPTPKPSPSVTYRRPGEGVPFPKAGETRPEPQAVAPPNVVPFVVSPSITPPAPEQRVTDEIVFNEALARQQALQAEINAKTLAPLTTAETSKTEVSNAETIRRNQGQLPPTGEIAQGSETPRRDDLQQIAPGQPEPVVTREVLAPQTEKAVKEIVQPEDVSGGVLGKPDEATSPQVQTEEAAQPPTPPPAQPVGTEAGKAVESITPEPPASQKQPWEMTKTEWTQHEQRGTWSDFTDPELSSARQAEVESYRALQKAIEDRKAMGESESIRKVMDDREGAKLRNQERNLADAKVDSAQYDYRKLTRRAARMATHEGFITRALSRGESVPPEVLADYPDLKPAPPAPTSEGKGKVKSVRAKTTQTELQAADDFAGKASAEAQKAVVAWATHVEDVVNPIKAKIRKIQSEVGQMEWDARRTKPEVKGKQHLTKKKFLEQYGVASMDEANALYKQKNAEWADLEKQLETAEAKRKDLEAIKDRRGKEWSAAATRAGELRRQVYPKVREGDVGKTTPPPTAGAGEKPIGMGGAVPEEFTTSPQTPTGIKNATVDKERSARGLPPAIQPARRSFGKVWDEAMAKIDADPGYPDRLINELRDKPRALTDLEDATLLHRQIDLQNEYGKATRDLAQAFDDGRTADVDELKVRVAEWSDKLLDIYNVGKKVGTETGRGLAARKMMAYEDFSLAQMELAKRSAKGGGQLTDAERAEITKLHEKIADLQKRYDDLVAANEAKATVPGVDEAIDEAKAGQKRDKASGKTRTPTDIKDVAGRIRAKLKESANSEISSDLQKIVRQMVEENPKITRDQLVNQVNELFPKWSRRETMDAISGYGDFKPLKKDEISIIVRDLKGQLQQIGKLEDMAAGQAPRKTGLERRTPTDEERRLIKQVEEAKRRGGYKVTDPATQLRTRLQAAKTAIQNQIKDLEFEIAKKERILKVKTQMVPDKELLDLRAKRDALKAEHKAIFGERVISDAQKIKMAEAALDRQIKDIEEQLRTGEIFPPGKKPPSTLTSPGIEAKLQTLAELKLRRYYERERIQPNVVPEIQEANKLAAALKSVKTRLENQITELDNALKKRQQIVKTKTALVYDDAANALKARRDELKKQYDEIFPRPELTDAQRLERWKTRTTNRIHVLQERLANRDFAKRTQRPPPPLDAAAMDLQAELFKAKQDFQRGLLEDRLAQRPWFERAQDTFLRWYRGGILSSPVVFGKLTAAAVMRAGLTPAEEAVGVGVSRAFPELAKRAPREGYWNSRAEANAIVKGLTRGVPDAWSILKTGESQLDVLYGKGREGAVGESQVRPFSIADLPGRTHGAWKATTKRAEFERAYEKIMAWYGRNGADTSNSGIQLQAAVEAYKHAQRSIFLQDNRLVSAFNSAINRLQQVDKSTGRTPVGGKLAATTARVLLPIVRVPSNIVAETFQFAFGSVTGPSRLIKAYAQGIEKLPPEQADLIMREIKKGSIGGVGLLLGYFMPQIWGGLYVPGDKQQAGKPKPGEAMLNGEIIPKWSLHHPFWETVQTGSTISRIMDDPKGGIGKAASASVLGLAEMNPLVKEMADVHKLFDPKQQTRYAAETLRSIIVPQGVQWAAKTFDTDVYGNKIERKPKDFIQHLNMGVPGLRETVPEMIGTPSSKKKR